MQTNFVRNHYSSALATTEIFYILTILFLDSPLNRWSNVADQDRVTYRVGIVMPGAFVIVISAPGFRVATSWIPFLWTLLREFSGRGSDQ